MLANGTFLNAGLTAETTLIPSFGYSEDAELSGDADRRKFGLAPKPRMHDLDDKSYRQRSALSRDSDWIDYRAQFCTAADQQPLTSGYVEREWTENGRHCIAYRMDSPMADIYSFVSARYAVKRDVWHGPTGDVAIEIDYQPGHEFNLDRMVAGVKDSLAYFTEHYGPYQHKIVRILEFPRFSRQGGFAESFPNTVPFNEAIGFTAKVDDRDPKDIDYPYFVTAHEVAHQWWAHQEVPAARAGRRIRDRKPRGILGPDGAQAEVRRCQDASLSQVRARSLSAGTRHRAEAGTTAAARRRRGLRALPERRAHALRAAGCHR